MSDSSQILLKTKLHRPRVAQYLVSRPSLFDQLSRCPDCELTLVSIWLERKVAGDHTAAGYNGLAASALILVGAGIGSMVNTFASGIISGLEGTGVTAPITGLGVFRLTTPGIECACENELEPICFNQRRFTDGL